MRFETEPGEQAQVDWGSLSYIGADGKQRRVWVFVMTLGWSRACYVELVRKADTAAFIQCHVNAFEYLGGVPRWCLYDNAKVITLGRDEEKRPIWNQRMLDFALRVGFEARLCQPYRAQTKGKVENGVKYVRRNMWPSIRFTTCPASTIFAGWRQSVLPVHLLGLAPLLGSVGPVAGDVKLQDDGVVHDPVNRRGGGHGVGKDALPLREDQV